MPATLASITAKRAVIEVPADATNPESPMLRITYKPRAYDKAFEESLNQIALNRQQDQQVAADMVIETFIRMVTAWDLTDEEMNPIPLTTEGLRCIPTRFLGDILEAIGEDQKPDPTTGNASSRRS